MVSEQKARETPRSEEREEQTTTTVTQDIKPPENLNPEEAKQIEQVASDIVRQLAGTKGEVEALKIEERISNMGMKVEGTAILEMKNLLGSRVGEMLRREKRSQSGSSQSVTKDLLKLREALREINPSDLEKSFIGRIPIIGDRILRIIERIASKYEHVSDVVREIEASLNEAKIRTLQDNAELLVAFEHLKQQQKVVEQHMYLGKMIVKKLDELISSSSDEQRKSELQEVLHNVLTRVDALARANAMFAQSFVQIKMTRDTNFKLVRGISIAVNQGMVVVTNAMLIYSAAQRQKEIVEALQQYSQFLEKTIVGVAEMIKENQSMIYGALREPLAAMEKIRQANTIMEAALKDRDRFIQEGIEAARKNIPELEKMSTDLMNRVKGVRVEEMSSIELNELPTRPAGGTERPEI